MQLISIVASSICVHKDTPGMTYRLDESSILTRAAGQSHRRACADITIGL